MSSVIVAPSILSADYANLGADIARVEQAGADWIHCDVMDGVFVPNISFGPFIVDQVNKMTDLPLDVHLMITEPLRYVQQFVDAGADYLTIHADACEDLEATIDAIAKSGAKVGVAVNPDKPVELFLPFLEKIDLVLIMSVHAGFGGQSFISDTMSKVSNVADIASQRGLSPIIEVDGGVNDSTARICRDAGATALVAGSYVFGNSSYETAIGSLR